MLSTYVLSDMLAATWGTLRVDPYLLRCYALIRFFNDRSQVMFHGLMSEMNRKPPVHRHKSSRYPPTSLCGGKLFSLSLDWKFLYDCIFLFICWFFRAVCQLPGPLVQAPDDTVTSDADSPDASVPALDWRLYVLICFARTQQNFRDS